MGLRAYVFKVPDRGGPLIGIGDIVILLVVAVAMYLGVTIAVDTPDVIQGPAINLAPDALPFYTLMSLGRMLLAYVLSMAFSITYGYVAARSSRAERWMLPILDILQSVPILSFLPIVLLSLTAVLPQRTAIELAAIVLIFTSQAWNLTFSFYQSLRTIPSEYREAAAVFRFSRWLRFRKLELPFASVGLIWNSVMSWAGGWFFLMAAEFFTVGQRDFQLPGLGAYLHAAASEGNVNALLYGIITLVAIIVLLDQLVWRPLLAWTERFRISQVSSDDPAESWFLNSLRRSPAARFVGARVLGPVLSRLNRLLDRPPGFVAGLEEPVSGRSWRSVGLTVVFAAVIGFGALKAGELLLTVQVSEWLQILVGALATTIRVAIAVVIALAWTIPVGVLIGTNRRAARVLQPVVQVAASIPATALFPVLLLGLLHLGGGAEIAAVLLMLLGTQWYLLFNVIAGASAIPQDLQYTTNLLRLRGWRRWRTLILPSLFPYIITGLITASGGAWNASIVAEFTEFGGEVSQVAGLGATISNATASSNYGLLLAATLAMIVLVVSINRFVWRRLFRIAEYRFRMDQ